MSTPSSAQILNATGGASESDQVGDSCFHRGGVVARSLRTGARARCERRGLRRLTPVDRQADANSYNQLTPHYVRVDGSFAFFEKNDTYFKPCAPVNIGDSSSAWVSLIPDQSNPNYLDGVSIVQIGIINCNTTSYDACDNTVNVAWASGGCGFGTWPGPGLISRTDPGSGHYFEVRLNNTLQQVEYYGPDGAFAKSTPYSDPGISCWITYPVYSAVFTETADRGDSIGGLLDSQMVRFTHLQYHSPQYGWARYGAVTTPSYQPFPSGDVHDPKFDHGDDGVGVGREVWMRSWTVYTP